MADQTPSWLSDSVGGSAPPVQQDAIESVPIDDSGVAASGLDASTAEVSSAPAEDEKDLPHIILMMRLANMAAAVALITSAVSTNAALTKRNDTVHNGIVTGTTPVGFYGGT
jgi:hypothetical protein